MYEDWNIIIDDVSGMNIIGHMERDDLNPPQDDWKLRIYAAGMRFRGEGNEDKVTLLGEFFATTPFNHRAPDTTNGPLHLYGVLLDGDGKIVGNPSNPFNLLFANPLYAGNIKYDIKWEPVTNVDLGGDRLTGYRMKLTVLKAYGGSPKAIFLMRKGVDGVGKYANEFLQVCAPGMFAQYPEAADQAVNGKYRTNVLDIVMQDVEELENMRGVLRGDIADLKHAMNVNSRLVNPEFESI